MLNGIFGRRSELEEVKAQVVAEMRTLDVTSDEWKRNFEHLEKLTILEATEARNKVSPDTMAVVAANLAGIIVIVGYEHAHVLASRALTFLLRTKHQ
jgi:hypothetical protein